MASIGIIHSGGKSLHLSLLSTNTSNQISSSKPFLPISRNTRKIPKRSITSSTTAVVSSPADEVADSRRGDGVFMEKTDSWVHDSVTEIVKNLKQAPLLVQIFAESDGGNADGRVKIQTEKAVEKNWAGLKGDWGSGESRSPDGLIFVEELELDCEDGDFAEEEEGVTRAWGMVVQGKCGYACYLLKTNKVCAGMGLGFCTHFCLMRVSNFRDSAFEQFKDSWLLQ